MAHKTKKKPTKKKAKTPGAVVAPPAVPALPIVLALTLPVAVTGTPTVAVEADGRTLWIKIRDFVVGPACLLLALATPAFAVGPVVGANCSITFISPADADVVRFHYEVGTGVPPATYNGPLLFTTRLVTPLAPNTQVTQACPAGVTSGQKSVRVRAEDAVGNVGLWAESPFSVDATNPGAVTGITVISGSTP